MGVDRKVRAQRLGSLCPRSQTTPRSGGAFLQRSPVSHAFRLTGHEKQQQMKVFATSTQHTAGRHKKAHKCTRKPASHREASSDTQNNKETSGAGSITA